MKMSDIPFGATDWSSIERTEHKGETGVAYWRTRQFGGIRVRMIEYSPGYKADHWCEKGHILLCLEGELHTELKDDRTFVLKPGMSYQAYPLRSPTEECVYVLSGSLVVELERQAYTLSAGDSITFEGISLKRFCCESNEETTWLAIITPPAF